MLNFDEINRLEQRIRQTPLVGMSKQEAEDWVFDYIVEFSFLAESSVVDDLGSVKKHISPEQLRDLIDVKIDGKTSSERIGEHIEALSNKDDPNAAYNAEKAIQAIAYTEAHRVANGVIHEVGRMNGAKRKQWQTMKDDRVRDTHEYLEGTVVPLNADFYSYTGAHGPYPGAFHDPAEDVNCRCYLKLSK